MFVFPSGYDAFGLVVLEALASGLPVVATRVGCAPDVVVDGVNGYLVEQDAAEIGERMEIARRGGPRRVAASGSRERRGAHLATRRRAVPRTRRTGRSEPGRRGRGRMTEPLRILHAISSDRFAGVEQFVRRLAIRQAQDGHTVTVLRRGSGAHGGIR